MLSGVQPRPQGPPREKLPTKDSSGASHADGPGDEVGEAHWKDWGRGEGLDGGRDREGKCSLARTTRVKSQSEIFLILNYCLVETTPKPEKIIEFLPSPSPPPVTESASPVPTDFTTWDQNPRDLEFSYERPYRIRIHPQSGWSGLTRTAKNLRNVTSSEHDAADIVQVLPKPPSIASIPSKCR